MVRQTHVSGLSPCHSKGPVPHLVRLPQLLPQLSFRDRKRDPGDVIQTGMIGQESDLRAKNVKVESRESKSRRRKRREYDASSPWRLLRLSYRRRSTRVQNRFSRGTSRRIGVPA